MAGFWSKVAQELQDQVSGCLHSCNSTKALRLSVYACQSSVLAVIFSYLAGMGDCESHCKIIGPGIF